jgi:Putative transposase
MTRRQWETLRNKLGRQRWNVYIRERYPHGQGVLTYLARYIRGGPLANTRLVSCGDGEVTFRYRVNGEGSASPRSSLITLSVAEFIRRYLLHVPEPGTRVVRAYGLYAPSRGDDLAVCRAQLGQESVVTPMVLDWQTGCSQRGAEHPERCPLCGRRLVRLGLISRSSIPPPGNGSSEVAA